MQQNQIRHPFSLRINQLKWNITNEFGRPVFKDKTVSTIVTFMKKTFRADGGRDFCNWKRQKTAFVGKEFKQVSETLLINLFFKPLGHHGFARCVESVNVLAEHNLFLALGVDDFDRRLRFRSEHSVNDNSIQRKNGVTAVVAFYTATWIEDVSQEFNLWMNGHAGQIRANFLTLAPMHMTVAAILGVDGFPTFDITGRFSDFHECCQNFLAIGIRQATTR